MLQGLRLCCAFSVEGEAGARAGARKSRRNPGATKCHYHHSLAARDCHQSCVTGPVQRREREREKDRVWPTQWQANGGPSCACACSSSVVASGGWWCRDHWLVREERKGARKAQVKAYMLENGLLQQTKHGALTLLLYSFFFFWLSLASSSSFNSYKVGFSKSST